MEWQLSEMEQQDTWDEEHQETLETELRMASAFSPECVQDLMRRREIQTEFAFYPSIAPTEL